METRMYIPHWLQGGPLHSQLVRASGNHREQLVEAVKEYQRTGQIARKQWKDYCDCHGLGTRDPWIHGEVFLERFFQLRDQGALPILEEQLHEKPLPPPDEDPEVHRNLLLAKLSHGISKSVRVRDAWRQFLFVEGGGYEARVDVLPASTIYNFLTRCPSLSLGQQVKVNPFDEPPRFPTAWTRCVRQLQSARLTWKHQWDDYCAEYGEGIRDPARHPPGFISSFLAQLRPRPPEYLLPKLADKLPTQLDKDGAHSEQIETVQSQAQQDAGGAARWLSDATPHIPFSAATTGPAADVAIGQRSRSLPAQCSRGLRISRKLNEDCVLRKYEGFNILVRNSFIEHCAKPDFD